MGSYWRTSINIGTGVWSWGNKMLVKSDWPDAFFLQFDPDKPFSAVVDYLNRKLKDKVQGKHLVSLEHLLSFWHQSTLSQRNIIECFYVYIQFIYIHQFCPPLDEEIGVLFKVTSFTHFLDCSHIPFAKAARN